MCNPFYGAVMLIVASVLDQGEAGQFQIQVAERMRDVRMLEADITQVPD